MATTTTQEKVLPDINRKYAYCLPTKNGKRPKGVYDEKGNPIIEPDYMPRKNFLLRSSIFWPGGKDPFSGKERAAGKYLIRYYDGCSTLFVDEQPQDKETIAQFIANTREVNFLNGFMFIYGYDTMLKTYADWASWNGESKFRIPQVEIQYIPVDAEKQAQEEEIMIDEMENALLLAKKADVKKMKSHAKYLGVVFEDNITGLPISDSSLRIQYRKKAQENPREFINTYNDESIQVTNWIETALETGEISTTLIPNRAVWAKKGVEICDLSGLKSRESIVNKLVELAQDDEFKNQLKGIYG